MNHVYSPLSNKQRINAIQRLTALWAFTESGLGGIMHALQIPFTGLLVGGMAVIMISMIAEFSEKKYKQILKSAIIVLIIKAMVSPFTPVTAYIAVSFQALFGYVLFNFIRINYISIALLSTIAMLESAMQKLLVLTLFFGESLWKAMDNMIAFAGRQFGNSVANGSYWIVCIYLFIYLAGGFFIAWLAWSTISNFNNPDYSFVLKEHAVLNSEFDIGHKTSSKKYYKKLWLLILVMVILSIILFLFSADENQGWLEVLKTVSRTLSAVLLWFMLIGPLLTKGIQKLLKKKESRYSAEVLNALAFVPVLKQLTALTWQQSKLRHGFKSWQFFISVLIFATLTYSEPGLPEQEHVNKPV
jgi:hypothetical protein